jgi:competence protein ComEC
LIACDVGQGDAILATYGSYQVLFDGGPGRDVISCLGRHIPFWDRKIEAVILTHPEKDHYGGLVYVFREYKVDYILANSLDSGTSEYSLLKSLVGGGGTKVVNPTTGTSMRLGLIHLDIVWPSKDYLAKNNVSFSSNVLDASIEKDSANEFSVVARLSLGDFDALLTGDIEQEASDAIADQNLVGEVDYIKIPHHGSKNGITQKLLEKLNPSIAVISVGKNSYGHPHKEILNMLDQLSIVHKRTDEMGDVELITDGKSWYLK